MDMPGRSVGTDYSFGNNGQMRERETFEGAYSAEFWGYDSRLGRRWELDPLSYEDQSPYVCFNNNPIFYADPLGLEGEPKSTGKEKGGDISADGNYECHCDDKDSRKDGWKKTLWQKITIPAIPKWAYSDSDWDDYNVASDYSRRDGKTAVNSLINIINGTTGLVNMALHPVNTYNSVKDAVKVTGFYIQNNDIKQIGADFWDKMRNDPNSADGVLSVFLTFGNGTGVLFSKIPSQTLRVSVGAATKGFSKMYVALRRACKISKPFPDWAKKGAHVHFDDIELALKPCDDGSILIESVFSSQNVHHVSSATKKLQILLTDPVFCQELIQKTKATIEMFRTGTSLEQKAIPGLEKLVKILENK